MNELMVAITSLQNIKTIAGLLIDERDRQKLASIQIDLTETILKTQTELSKIMAGVIEKDTLISTLSKRIRE